MKSGWFFCFLLGILIISGCGTIFNAYEAQQSVKDKACCVTANGAVRRIDNHARSALNDRKGLHGRRTVEDLLHQLGELTETNAARHTFSAGLGVTKGKKVFGKIHRT